MANYTSRANVASTGAVTLPEGSNYIVVTGTTTITSLSTRPSGEVIVLRFSGVLTLTHNVTSLILQNAANYLTVAGDMLIFISEGSGNWREISRDYATGKVAFPATAVATVDANTLDDYEEGDWTPAATFGGAAVGMTFSKQEGTYTKIGRQAGIHCDMRLSAKGTSVGNVAVTGLPFTIIGHSPLAFYPGTITFADAPLAYASSGGTSINLEEITNAGAGTNLTNADFADTSMVFLGGVHMT